VGSLGELVPIPLREALRYGLDVGRTGGKSPRLVLLVWSAIWLNAPVVRFLVGMEL
jgi:hypothetical protein